jgi:segregation and condensation protein B
MSDDDTLPDDTPDPAAPDAEAPAAGAADTADASEAPADGPSRELVGTVEALVFASPEPVTLRTLHRLLADEPKELVQQAVEVVRAEYGARPGLQFVDVAGGFQIVTRPELHEWVRRLFHERSTRKLTVQGLETLAVIAYKQPVTALEVSEVRGVDAAGVLSTLLDRHLVKIVGRKNVVGRPFLYGTTREFLVRFGLNDIRDLPRVEDMVEALGFDPPAGLIEQTPREEMLPLDADEEDDEDGFADDDADDDDEFEDDDADGDDDDEDDDDDRRS